MKEFLDKMQDECGVFGVWGQPAAANLVYLGLYSLQHRGQEGAGIATLCKGELHSHRKMGLVSKIFKRSVFEKLPGETAIGHVRYSTAGLSELKNVQPLIVNCAIGPIAIAHNGNLTNATTIRKELERKGSIFQTDSDTEVILHLIAGSQKTGLKDKIIDALQRIEGAFSLLILTKNGIFAARDRYGYRPLVFGRLREGYLFSSETCAFYIMEATYDREIKPGEILSIDENGFVESEMFAPPVAALQQCVFEYIYLSRPDSNIFGQNVYEVRKRFGEQLAREGAVEADMIVPVPDSGVPAALGYAQESKVPFELGIMRNHYIGRTFIEPEQSIRDFGVKIKLNPIPNLLMNKRVVVVDDSLVRGTTAKKVVKMLRQAGAKEVHLRISSPQIANSCLYGVDTPTTKELLANRYSAKQINDYIGADSLVYLSLEGLFSSIGAKSEHFCIHCFEA